jgi:hypothetical protein
MKNISTKGPASHRSGRRVMFFSLCGFGARERQHRKGLRPISFNPCSAPATPAQTWGTRQGDRKGQTPRLQPREGHRPFLCHPERTRISYSQLSPVPRMWFSLKRTTCSRPKPQLSTGNQGKPTSPGVPWRDLQFRGPFVEMFSRERSSRLLAKNEFKQPGHGPAGILASTADAPSPALTGISRVTLGHREKLAIQRMSDTARLRRHAHAERDSLERSAA